jgi:deaminated glutathione amidase
MSKGGAKDILNVAICQMTSVDDYQKNLLQIQDLLTQIKKPEDTDLICFPENALFQRLSEGERVQTFELSDSVFDPLVLYATKYKTYIYLGSVPLNIKKQVHNSSVMITPEGKKEALYQKIHLFDIDLEGASPIRESDAFVHGEGPKVYDIHGWKFGLSICYDLRFSELYYYYSQKTVDVICIPSAFTVPTGEAHWHILTRARAIETQSYVLAAAQGGNHGGRRKTYGHSVAINPWGEIIGEVEGDRKIIEVELKRSEISRARKQIPMREHRRRRKARLDT